MATTIATVDNDGQLVLPAEVQRALGILPGARVEIVLQEHGVELLVQNQPTHTKEERYKAIRELRGMYAGQPSIEDEYFRDRDTDKW